MIKNGQILFYINKTTIREANLSLGETLMAFEVFEKLMFQLEFYEEIPIGAR